MTDPPGPDELTPVERSLGRHLELLRAEPPLAPRRLDAHIIRSARWQRSIRRPLITFGRFAGALRDGIRLLLAPADPR